MLDSTPFYWRVIALLALMAAAGGIDHIRHGSKATRFPEYGFILLTGVVGSLVAMGCDLATSTISREYFIFGKGLPEESFRQNVLLFGAKTGFSGSVVAGALLLFGSGAKRPAWRALILRLWIPVAAAIAMGALLPSVASGFDPSGYAAVIRGIVTGEQLRHFRIVWWAHTGFYLGLLLGVAALVATIRRRAAPASVPDAPIDAAP